MTDTEAEINEGEPEDPQAAAAGAGEAAPEPVETQAAGERSSIFESLQLFNARRMPTLDFINDRFAKGAKDALHALIRRPVEIIAQPARICTCAELGVGAEGRGHVTVGKLHPLKGMGAWVASSSLVYLVVDTLFGGDSRVPPKLIERDLSATELRILRRMMDSLVIEYEKAWRPVHETRFEYVREEPDLQRADIASPEAPVLQCAFTLTINGHQAQLDFCIPFRALDPLKALLFEPARNLQQEIDAHWSGRLEHQVQTAEVELVVVLAREEMRIADVLALNVGDIVPIEVLEPVTAYVDDLPMVLGQYGVRNGRYAIKVQHVKHPAELLGRTRGREQSS